MSERPDWDRQFAETEQERNERQAARRKAGNSKLVYDKEKHTIITERTVRRVTAGPYTLEIPANGVATLHEADGAGIDHQLPGGVGHLEALVQFAGEVIRLQAMVEQTQTDRTQERDALLALIVDLSGNLTDEGDSYSNEGLDRIRRRVANALADRCPEWLHEYRDGWQCDADPCTEEARDHGCTCRLSTVHSNDIDPPEPVIDRDCPLHGNAPDPDQERERRRDDANDTNPNT